MAAQASMKVRVSFTYRGGTKIWSQRYHFTGGKPSTTGHWETMMDSVTDGLKGCLQNGYGQIIEAIGYDAGSDLPDHSKSYTKNGSGGFTNVEYFPGDVACILRYATDARTSKNHAIYLFNYFHGAFGDSRDSADSINRDQKAAIESFGTAWISGYSDGAVTHVRCGPNGAVALSRYVNPYVTHRDFRR